MTEKLIVNHRDGRIFGHHEIGKGNAPLGTRNTISAKKANPRNAALNSRRHAQSEAIRQSTGADFQRAEIMKGRASHGTRNIENMRCGHRHIDRFRTNFG